MGRAGIDCCPILLALACSALASVFFFCEMGLLLLPQCPCDQADTEERGPCGLGLVFYFTLGQRCGPHPSPAILL